MEEQPIGYIEFSTLPEQECLSELETMLNAYDGSAPFLEWAQGYIVAHPSRYDLSTIVKYIHPMNETPELAKTPEQDEEQLS